MTFSSANRAGSKLQQFTIANVEPSFAFFIPKPPLSRFVENIWAAKGGEFAFRPERILPTGTFELAINLRRNKLSFHKPEYAEAISRFSGAVVSGAHARSFVPADTEEVSVIGVHFKPGGAFPFFGAPAGEFADKHIDLGTLWGPSAVRLRERLCEAATVGQRFQLLQQELLRHLREGVEQHYAVSAALEFFRRNETESPVREAAKNIGLSQRRFIQVFKSEVGLTPKLFSRIQRFQRILSSVKHDAAPDWISVALQGGYCDQSHFIREFVEFSGLSPTDYLSRRDRSF